MKSYRTAVVGCGRIGTSFDSPGSPVVLTHAHAYTLHPSTNLTCVMDVDLSAATKSAALWNCLPYTNLDLMLAQESPEIISVAVPSALHDEVLRRCLHAHPRAVIAEKPLTLDLASSKSIVSAYESAGIPLLVNFSRRYDAFTPGLRNRLRDGSLGRVLSASVRYSKGILNNGSHAVDLASFLFGECTSSRALGSVIDHSPDDPTVNAFLSFEHCPSLFLQAVDERSYSIFEFDIFTERARISYEQTGEVIREFQVSADPTAPGYRVLQLAKEFRTELDRSVLNIVDNVIRHLDHGDLLLSSGRDALVSQSICESLRAAC